MCVLLETQVQQITVNLKSVVGPGLFGGHALPAPVPWCSPGTSSRGSAQCTVMKREASGANPAPPGWAATLGVRHSSLCLWQRPGPSLNLFPQCLQQFTQQGRGTRCLPISSTDYTPPLSSYQHEEGLSLRVASCTVCFRSPCFGFCYGDLHTMCADLLYILIWCSLAPTRHLGWFGDMKLLGKRWREWAFFCLFVFLLKINSSAYGGGGAHL